MCYHRKISRNFIGLMLLKICFIITSAVPMKNEDDLKKITSENQREYGESFSVLPRVPEIIQHCLKQSNLTSCLKKQIVLQLDEAIKDNGTWYLSDFLAFEKDQSWQSNKPMKQDYRDLNSVLINKIQNLAESRTLRIRITEPESHQRSDVENLFVEGRKKKDKDKGHGMAMMGVIAIAGWVAQLFMGKMIMLAGAAFILAKIALIYSILTKHSHTKSSGSEHVVYAETASHGHAGGYQRSIPYYSAQDYAYSSHLPYDDQDDTLDTK